MVLRFFTGRPTSFIGAFAVWAMTVGMSLVLPGNGFELSPAWASLQVFQVQDHVWGSVMMLNGMIILYTMRLTNKVVISSVSLVSAIMWLLLGMSMVVNAYKAGFLSVVGAFSVWCALQALIDMDQWVIFQVREDHV